MTTIQIAQLNQRVHRRRLSCAGDQAFCAGVQRAERVMNDALYYHPLTIVYNTKELAPNARRKDWLAYPRLNARLGY